MVLINMMAIFPLYFLVKKINKGRHISACYCTFSAMDYRSIQKRTRICCGTSFLLSWCSGIDWSIGLGWIKLEELLAKAFLSDSNGRVNSGYAIFDYHSVLKIIVALYGIFGILAILKLLKSIRPLVKDYRTHFRGGCILLLIGYSGLIQRYLSMVC